MTTRPTVVSGQRGIITLMGLAAASLAVASALHLSGLVRGHGHGFSPVGAGIPEAVIGVLLLCGAVSLARRGAAGRPAALGATVFAIAGFIFGLTITTRGGDLPDIAYHATVLPLLLVTLMLIVRSKPTAPEPGDSRLPGPGAEGRPVRS